MPSERRGEEAIRKGVEKPDSSLSLFLSDVGPEFVIEVTVEHATKEYSALQYYWVRGCSLATHVADGAGATSSSIIV